MATEIERKFLIDSDTLQASGMLLAAEKMELRQGYIARGSDLAGGNGNTVRIRIAGNQAFLTVKGPTHGISRAEFEYPISLTDADALMQLCTGSAIHKTRYYLPFAGHLWEIDEFHDAHQGLWLAEIELPSEETRFEKPSWVLEDVSDNPGYHNSVLSLVGYSPK